MQTQKITLTCKNCQTTIEFVQIENEANDLTYHSLNKSNLGAIPSNSSQEPHFSEKSSKDELTLQFQHTQAG